MPVTCIVYGCGSRANRDPVSFFRIPSGYKRCGRPKQIDQLSLERRKRWIMALRREGLTEKILLYQRVCSKHFVTGKPADGDDKDHPDWVPSVEMGYQKSSSNLGKPAALDDVNHPDWVPSINLGYTKNSKKGLPSHRNEEEAFGMHDDEIQLAPTVKVEKVDFSYEQETQELEESLRNVASNKKALTDIKIKYLEEEHRVKMDILNIEKENAEIQNETLKIEYEIKKIDLINQRMLEIDN